MDDRGMFDAIGGPRQGTAVLDIPEPAGIAALFSAGNLGPAPRRPAREVTFDKHYEHAMNGPPDGECPYPAGRLPS